MEYIFSKPAVAFPKVTVFSKYINIMPSQHITYQNVWMTIKVQSRQITTIATPRVVKLCVVQSKVNYHSKWSWCSAVKNMNDMYRHIMSLILGYI